VILILRPAGIMAGHELALPRRLLGRHSPGSADELGEDGELGSMRTDSAALNPGTSREPAA
jgi:hypothetical protein